MAVKVHIDQPGGSGSHHIIQGWSLTRLATVTGLVPNGTQTTAKLFYAAVEALIDVTGPRGTPYEIGDVTVFLEQFIFEGITGNDVKIRVLYKGYPAAQYELDSCLSAVESNTDRDGELIVLQYQYPDDYEPNPRNAGRLAKQGAMIQKLLPEASFTVKFWLADGTIDGAPASAVEVATWFAGMFLGKMNAAPYAVGRLYGTAHQWLCTRFRAVSRDGGRSYECSFTVQFRTQGWDHLVYFINPDDGKPPHDLVPNVGMKIISGNHEVGFPTFTFTDN